MSDEKAGIHGSCVGHQPSQLVQYSEQRRKRRIEKTQNDDTAKANGKIATIQDRVIVNKQSLNNN